MATIAGRDPVARPGPDWRLQPYGLFTVANGPLPLSEHQSVGGLYFQSPYCGIPQGYDVACTPGTKAESLVGGYQTVNGDPFVVLAGSKCGSLSGDDRDPPQYLADLVMDRLRGGEQRAVEMIFSRGLNGQAPGLVSGGTQLTAAANMVRAFGELEGAYAALYGLPAVIHVPIVASDQVKASHLIEKDSAGIWRTAVGNAVSFGNYAGYSQAGAAPAAGHVNLYITGQVSVWRNDIFVSPWDAALDKTTNQVQMYAERTYIVAYECSSVAIDVDYTVCC